MLFALVFLAIGLTATMFATRNSMLGFPAAIFWAILSGHSYQQSSVTWDIYYFLFIATGIGMTTFCALGAYGLREKRDSLGDIEMEKGDGDKYIDEGGRRAKADIDSFDDDSNNSNDSTKPSSRSQAVQARAARRRSRGSGSSGPRWGEYR